MSKKSKKMLVQYRISPPAGSKKEVLKFRSNNNIVIAPAKTGKASSNKIAVIRTDHTNRGIFSKFIDKDRILIIVEIKFTAPRIEETPAK
jgi:arginine repressor